MTGKQKHHFRGLKLNEQKDIHLKILNFMQQLKPKNGNTLHKTG